MKDDAYNAIGELSSSFDDATCRTIFSMVPLAGILYDEALQIRHTNTRAVRVLGLDPSETSLEQAVTSSRAATPALLLEALRSEGTTYHIVEDSNGSPRCIEAGVHDVSDGLSIAWFQDVTDARQVNQFRLLAEVGRSRSTQSTTVAFGRRIVDSVLEILGYDIAVLTVRDRDVLRPIASRGLLLEPGAVLAPELDLYVQKAISSGEPVVGDGSEWEAGELAEMTGLHYVVPLVSSGEVIGTLHLGAIDSNPRMDFLDAGASLAFEALDQSFLSALSGYVGAALANTRLFEQVGQEQAKLSTVVESMPLGVVVYNRRGEVLLSNSEATAIARFKWLNLNTDSRPYRLRDTDGNVLPRGEWPFFRAVRTDSPVLDETVVLDFGDEQTHVDVSVVPVPTSDNLTTYVATIQDVSERVRDQKRREELLSVTGHELRSPLTPLIGFLQMLRKQAEGGDAIDPGLLQRAENQVQRLARLIETMLDLARIENDEIPLDVQSVDVRDLIHSTVAIWSAHPRGVRVQGNVPDAAVMVSVDADRIEQVLTNLVDNAFKHCGDGDRVWLSVVQDVDHVTIEVGDEGAGIPESIVPRIFDRFYTKGDGSNGIGLGLYVCREIVERHGGTIEVTSDVGTGTKMLVRLPHDSH